MVHGKSQSRGKTAATKTGKSENSIRPPAHYSAGHTQERCDPTPVEMPIGFKTPETLESIIGRMIVQERAIQAQANEVETPEEADDFSIDEPEFLMDMSPYELPETYDEESDGTYMNLEPSPDGGTDDEALAQQVPDQGTAEPSDEASNGAGTPDSSTPVDQ